MDEAQQPHAAPRTQEDQEQSGGISRGKTIALWVGVAALLLALLGSLMIVLKSLQADRTLAQISKSAGSVAVPPPEPRPSEVPPADMPAARAVQATTATEAAPPPAASPPRQPAEPVRRAQALPQAKSAPQEAKPKKSRLSVERRLAQCKELAGEAAAACFRRACNSYAYNAPICVNDRRQ